MVQHNNEHLTIAQLSAYADKELAPKELALCDAHLQTCQACREALADLQLTSALLHGMPQVEVPRSFVLPTNLVALPVTPTQEPRPVEPSRSLYIWRSSLRTLSTIAAVVGLMFILAGAITALPHGGGTATMSSANAPVSNGSSQRQSGSTPATIGPREQATHNAAATGKETPTPTPASTPTAPVFAHQASPQPPESQSAVDLGQPSGRLEVGSACLLLGILGLFVSRRFRRKLDN